MLPGKSPAQKLSSTRQPDLSREGLGLDKGLPCGGDLVKTIEQRLLIFDQLVQAVASKTVTLEDLRYPATPELKAIRENYINQLEAKVRAMFEGPKSEEMEILIRAAAQRGVGHRLILLRLCRQHLR